MGKTYDSITPELTDWLNQQKIFFVATAPLAAEGLINCSPKGMDTFRILSPHEVAYLDLTGSGVETIAHVRENARIVFMFCAFTGPPKIIRLHGRGEVVASDSQDFAELKKLFPDYPGSRAIVRVNVNRISDSCGFSVPRYEYVDERDQLLKWAQTKGDDGLKEYRTRKNSRSLDGLQGLS